MQDFETEEQQIAALKKWWHENSTSLLVGLGLGAAILFGGRYYLEMQNEKSAIAGDLYFQVADGINNKSDEAALEASDKLINEYKTTPYAALASLLMARYEFEQGKLDEAAKQLQWVVTNAGQPELENIARLHLARIRLANKDYDGAMSLLNVKTSSAFVATFEELKGDIYVAQEQLAEARIAYDKAIAANGVKVNALLALKRQDIGSIEPDTTDPVVPPA